MIRGDCADVILSGGTHSMIHPFGLTGFILLTALSTRNDEPTRASRPFDRDRDGFILGEGAGMLILEELEHAKARGARIYGEIVGYGSTADAFRITDSHDEGAGRIACLREALADARVNPDEIDYINAHGTSTSVNDSIETLAIKRVFGDAAYRVPISSTKSMMGHLIAAAGSVEAIVCLLTIRDGVLAPDHQPRPSRRRIATWTTFPTRPGGRTSTSRSRTALVSAARTSRSSSDASPIDEFEPAGTCPDHAVPVKFSRSGQCKRERRRSDQESTRARRIELARLARPRRPRCRSSRW